MNAPAIADIEAADTDRLGERRTVRRGKDRVVHRQYEVEFDEASTNRRCVTPLGNFRRTGASAMLVVTFLTLQSD